jgi:hypothetical protein
MDQENQGLFDLHLDEPSISHFSESARWAKFIAIVGFIFCAFMVMGAIFMGAIFSSLGTQMAGFPAFAGGGLISAMYLIFAVIFFFPNLFLYRFAAQIQQSIRLNEQPRLQSSLKNLKSYFRFIGILYIVVIAFYILIFVFAIFAGIMAS